MKYSIVIPIYNEVGNIQGLIEEIENAMAPFNNSWELIFVDDGSKDGTKELLFSLRKDHIRSIHLKKNCGQTSALDAGFKKARGDCIITLDGDGQNDPNDIPLLIREMKTCDLISGKRKKREDSVLKRIISRYANSIRQAFLQDQTSDTGCSLKIMRRDKLLTIKLYKGMHRFLPALFQIEGYSTKEVEVNHRPRRYGKSKYSLFSRGPSLLYDLASVCWMKQRKLSYEIDNEHN